MHKDRRHQWETIAPPNNLQKKNVSLASSEEAERVHKKACLDNQTLTAPFTESESLLGTAASARTPFKLDNSGWIQLQTPSPHLTAQTPQQNSWPIYTQYRQQAAPVNRALVNDLQGSKKGLLLPAGHLQEDFFGSPAVLTSSPHDFSTEEVKKELSRLQALSQQLPSSNQAAGTLASDQSCRQLEWSEPSSEDHLLDSSTNDLSAAPLSPTELSSATQQTVEAVESAAGVQHASKGTFQLAPGFALAADTKAVERQQTEKPICKLKRKLSDWGVPPRVAAVSSLQPQLIFSTCGMLCVPRECFVNKLLVVHFIRSHLKASNHTVCDHAL